MKYAKIKDDVVVQVKLKLSQNEIDSGLFVEGENPVCGQKYDRKTLAFSNPEKKPKTINQQKEDRAAAYSNPLTGTDILLIEALRKDLSDPEGAASARAEAAKREVEIKALYPINT